MTRRDLRTTVANLNRTFGSTTVCPASKHPSLHESFLPSGSLTLDAALGGGYARGRIIEVFGPPSSGKTTLALHALATCQKANGVAAIIDSDHSFPSTYAQAIGLDLSTLLVSQPEDAESALEIIHALAASGACDVIALDSLASLVPRDERTGDATAETNAQARLLSRSLRTICGVAYRTRTTLLVTNQLRTKTECLFGNRETTCGGNALRYYASQRVDLRSIGTTVEADTVVGIRVRAKVVKNKLIDPFRTAEFPIRSGSGIDAPAELLDEAVAWGIIAKEGSRYTVPSDFESSLRSFSGRSEAIGHLRADPRVHERLVTALRERLGLGPA